jgi:hypothetical protein
MTKADVNALNAQAAASRRKPEPAPKAPEGTTPAPTEEAQAPETPEVKPEEPKAAEPKPAKVTGQELIDKLRQERRVKRLEEKGY